MKSYVANNRLLYVFACIIRIWKQAHESELIETYKTNPQMIHQLVLHYTKQFWADHNVIAKVNANNRLSLVFVDILILLIWLYK